MNIPPPILPRLHWSPIAPSWIVSIGLVLLAALPHQIPVAGRSVLTHPIGAIAFAAISSYVAWMAPVLGAAMMIFLAGILMDTMRRRRTEPFAATNLYKERVQDRQKHRWFGEEILAEHPKAVQQRTENPTMTYDEIVDHETPLWQDELMLNEHPVGIQEKPVGTVPEYDEGGASYGHR